MKGPLWMWVACRLRMQGTADSGYMGDVEVWGQRAEGDEGTPRGAQRVRINLLDQSTTVTSDFRHPPNVVDAPAHRHSNRHAHSVRGESTQSATDDLDDWSDPQSTWRLRGLWPTPLGLSVDYITAVGEAQAITSDNYHHSSVP
ncbi:hypothetical protein Tco_0455551 [Tanacetum coccineum]